MAVSVARDKAPMLPMVKDAIKYMFHEPNSVFFPVRVMDLLFDGIGIDCSSEEFAAKAVCTALETEPTIDKYNDTTFMFSIFGPVSEKLTKKFKIFHFTPEIFFYLYLGIYFQKHFKDCRHCTDEFQLSVAGSQDCFIIWTQRKSNILY